MDLNEENIQRLTSWVNKEARKEEIKTIIDPTNCDFLTADTVVLCPACFDIPRFPLIFSCGHLECHKCYMADFKTRARRRGSTFFTICPMCRAEVRPETVLTASLEIKHHPNSKISKFYSGLRVQCSNFGCNQFIPYTQLTQHEVFQCPERNIQCPAESCPCIGRPKELLSHTIICPLHHIYCNTCESVWPVTVFGHNCIKVLQAKRITNIDSLNKTIQLTDNHTEPNDSVILPDLKSIARPDEEALQTILNVVRFNRGRLIFGRGSNIPEDSELPAAPPATHHVGFDELDALNKAPDMLDTARDISL